MVVTVLILGAAAALAEDFDHEPTMYVWRGSFNEEFQSHDVGEWVVASWLGRSEFVYEYPMLALIPVIIRRHPDRGKTEYYYNFRTAACLLAMLIERGLDGRAVIPAPGVHARGGGTRCRA